MSRIGQGVAGGLGAATAVFRAPASFDGQEGTGWGGVAGVVVSIKHFLDRRPSNSWGGLVPAFRNGEVPQSISTPLTECYKY